MRCTSVPGFLAPLALAAALAAAAPGTGAATLLAARVRESAASFVVHSEVRVALPAARVREILTRYRRLPEVNDGIRRVEILTAAGDRRTRVRVISEVCVLLVCLDYRWIQRVSELANGDILAEIEPTGSDFRSGRLRWSFVAEGETSVLIFDATLTPDFWFPPLIGPWLIRHKLGGEALQTAEGVERVAAAVK